MNEHDDPQQFGPEDEDDMQLWQKMLEEEQAQIEFEESYHDWLDTLESDDH